MFDSQSKQLRHEHVCQAPILNASRQLPPFAGQRYGPFASSNPQAAPLRTSFDAPSPPTLMPGVTDSDDSSVVYTPATSRANSVGLGMERRHSGVQRTVPRYTKQARGSSPQDNLSSQDKAKKKQEKEKQNRGEQGAVLYRQEDALRNYAGWERKEQSGGNGNGAGLQCNKINLLQGSEALLYHYLHEARCQAIREGTVREFEARNHAIIESALERAAEGRSPYTGTFMYSEDDVPCRHKNIKSKACEVHGHPDWRECRKIHTDRIFRMNEERYRRQMRR